MPPAGVVEEGMVAIDRVVVVEGVAVVGVAEGAAVVGVAEGVAEGAAVVGVAEGAAVEGAPEEMEEEVPVEVMPVIGVVEEHAETGAMYMAMLVSSQ